ncbi:MAG: hypothetical protein IT565_09200 [Rhodospirillales bacterium]|nr:hypothetical protein [Rhodospirillales bacterium]
MVALHRLPIFLLGAICLVTGLLAGLTRMGAHENVLVHLVPLHGAMMVGGFFGTVIGLERAVAMRQAWVYAAPIASGLGGLALLFGLPTLLGGVLMALGSLLFALAGLVVALRQTVLFTSLMALAALAWLAGNALWLAGWDLAGVVPWWMAFLVLTIAGERLELSRLLAPTKARLPTLLLALAPLVGGLLIAQPRLFGLGLVALALWLAVYDLARRNLRQSGLARYVAIAILGGYVWLAFSGGLMLVFGLPAGGPIYDAILHDLFLGFVFMMVFGHAPIILPAVLRLDVPFTPWLYLPMGALHLAVALRMAGDLHDFAWMRHVGAELGALTIFAFLLTVAGLGIANLRRQKKRPKKI